MNIIDILRKPIAPALLLACCLHHPNAFGGKRYALVVGVSQCENAPELQRLDYPGTDAQGIAAEFIKLGFDKVITLCQESCSAQPTRQKIVESLKEIAQTAKKGDLVVFAFSGHGVFDSKTTSSLILSSDASPSGKTPGISLEGELFKQMPASKGIQQVFIIDACRSNSSGFSQPGTGFRNPPAPEHLVYFASCSTNEKSEELPELMHGVYSFNIIRGLKGNADKDQDGEVSITELSEFASAETVRMTDRGQHPVTKFSLSGEAKTFGKLVRKYSGRDLRSVRDFQRSRVAKLPLKNADFSGANLSGLDLSNLNLSGANFNGAKLVGTDLSHCRLSRSDLTNANLTNANLTGAWVIGVDVKNATFDGANLTDWHDNGLQNRGKASFKGAYPN